MECMKMCIDQENFGIMYEVCKNFVIHTVEYLYKITSISVHYLIVILFCLWRICFLVSIGLVVFAGLVIGLFFLGRSVNSSKDDGLHKYQHAAVASDVAQCSTIGRYYCVTSNRFALCGQVVLITIIMWPGMRDSCKVKGQVLLENRV